MHDTSTTPLPPSPLSSQTGKLVPKRKHRTHLPGSGKGLLLRVQLKSPQQEEYLSRFLHIKKTQKTATLSQPPDKSGRQKKTKAAARVSKKQNRRNQQQKLCLLQKMQKFREQNEGKKEQKTGK